MIQNVTLFRQFRDKHLIFPVFSTFALQAAHRLGAVALLAIIAAWAQIYLGQSARWGVAIAFAASNLGLSAALFVRILNRREQFSREATGVAFFNLIFLLLSLQLMLVDRIDLIRAAAEKFFTPS